MNGLNWFDLAQFGLQFQCSLGQVRFSLVKVRSGSVQFRSGQI